MELSAPKTEEPNFVAVEEAVLYYRTIEINKADATVLVFLHDALGSTAQWKDFPDLLARRTGLNAVVFDRQGHGRSSPVLKTRTKNYLHDEAFVMLPAFLEELKIERPILFGHSDGGTIALLYASRFSPAAIICEAAHALVETKTIEGIQTALTQQDVLIRKLRKYHGSSTEDLFDAWYKTWLAEDFRDWNIEADLKYINCPTLIIQGENDQYASVGHPERIEQAIGENARSVFIGNCGHTPHLEATEEILETTTEFIRNLSGLQD